jgi:large subunit ribosomal protein L18
MTMAKGPRYHVPFRRRREGKTDYRKRLRHLQSGLPRLVVRRTNTKVIVQVSEHGPGGDRVLAQAISPELAKYGWTASMATVPAAYLTGLLAAKRAASAGVEGAVLDGGLGRPTLGGKVYSALQGALDGGLYVPHGEEILPPEDRIKGDHLSEGVPEMFDNVKDKIMEGSA